MGTFFGQRCRAYRDFQIAFTVLTLNFFIPAIGYTFSPDEALAGFMRVNALLGGGDYPFSEGGSQLWRVLAAANVMTLAFMCALLQADLRRLYPVLLPLCFLKAYAAIGLLALYVSFPSVPLFGAGALLDGVSCGAFIYFARGARRAIEDLDDALLVPRPVGGGRVGG